MRNIGIRKRLRSLCSSFSLLNNTAVVFLYHTVEENISPWIDGHRYITPLAVFERQISFIRHHFDIVDTKTLIEVIRRRNNKNSRVAVIHFDDGFSSYKNIAFPYFKSLNIPSTVFFTYNFLQGEIPLRNKVAFCLNIKELDREFRPRLLSLIKNHGLVSGKKQYTTKILLSLSKCIEEYRVKSILPNDAAIEIFSEKYDKPFMSAKDVLEIKNDSLVEIGSHTKTHAMLSQLPYEVQSDEILGGHNALESLIGRKLDYFAYPFGGKTHFGNSSKKIVKDNRLVAFSTYGGINRFFSQSDIRRITLSDHAPLDIKSTLIDSVKREKSIKA